MIDVNKPVLNAWYINTIRVKTTVYKRALHTFKYIRIHFLYASPAIYRNTDREKEKRPIHELTMFVLSEMKDTVRIPPHTFQKDTNDAIIHALNTKLANKVVHNVGLCIALWDITKLEDSYIFPGDGSHHTVVHFRYVVFRPFMDQILVGKIKSCSKEGVHVWLGFFDDIIIPADSLQHPSRFDEKEQLWAWEYQTEDGKHDLFMDVGEQIRFRVVDEVFVDTTPTGPDGLGAEGSDMSDPEAKKSPYTLIGSISEPGLGLLSWWNT